MTETTEDFGDFFGQAKQGGNEGFGYKNFTLSEKDANIYRLAPPVKSLKNVGRWSFYDTLHFGYSVPNPENPDKPRARPFRCIHKKNRATGMIEQDCPECTDLEAREKEIELLKSQQIAAGKSEAEAEEFVSSSRRQLRMRNLDKKHYVLAKNLNGEWGVLKIPHRAKQALDNLIERYMKDNNGEHPLTPGGGVWFEFTRKGKGLQTEHHVAIVQENLGGGRFQYKSGELTALDIEGIKKCPDLATLNDSRVLTYDQILALVRSGGNPDIVATVFQQGRKQSAVQQAAFAPLPATPAASAPGALVTPAPAPASAPAPVMSQADMIAALQAQLAALQNAGVQVTPAPVLTTPVATTGTNPVAQQTVTTATKAAPVATPAAPAQPMSFSDLMQLDPRAFLERFPDPNKK